MSFFTELKRRNVIRVAAAYIVASWLVVEATSLILDIYSAPDWVIKVLIALLVLAFPIALLFSWVYELTPDGIKKESEVEVSQSIAAATAKRLDVITIVLVIAAVGFVVFERYVRDPVVVETGTVAMQIASGGQAGQGPEAEQVLSIAVLPFADMSPDKDQEYFSDGMSEELLHLLAKVPGLKVAARTSSFRFKGDDRDISEVAGMLGVNHVLEGSVRKAGKRIRVTAQLIDARDGFHIWSETYDRDLQDALVVQDEISGKIVQALATHLDIAIESHSGFGRGQINPEAYDLYLRGNFAKQRRTPEALLRAIDFYQQSVAMDPDLAPAWGALGRAAGLATEFFPPRDEEFRQLSEEAARRALALDANEPQALAVIAGDQFDIKHNFSAGLAAYERLVAADPSDTEAMSWLAQRYRTVGYLDKAEALNRRAYAIDSLSPRVVLGIVRTLAIAGKFAEARKIAEKALVDLAGHQYAVLAMAQYHLYSHDLRGAESTLARFQTGHSFLGVVQMQLTALMGDLDGTMVILDRLVERLPPGHFGVSIYQSVAHYMSGELDTARAKMLEARQRGYGSVVWWINRPGTLAHVPAGALPMIADYAPWVSDYPEVVRGYETLGIDIVAEVKAAGNYQE